MNLSEKKVGPGWAISVDGYNIITEIGNIKNPKDILQNALDFDLKETGSPVLANEISKNKIQELVLQIQKVRNVSAPKANEDSQGAPRMLKITLTDGHSFCQAIEIASIPSLSLDKTAPGSKILIKNARICSGYVLLDSQSCVYLGGKVPALYEKWEISRSVLKHSRSSSNTDGPPAWVKFGSKIVSSVQDQYFKSLDNKAKEVAKQNAEFDELRKDAIVEASTGAVKKVFGGGLKQAANIQRNDVNKKFGNSREYGDKERYNKERVKREPKEKMVDKPQKPMERVSLFQFLEEKLPGSDLPEENVSAANLNAYPVNRPYTNQNPRNNNSYSRNNELDRNKKQFSPYLNNHVGQNRYQQHQYNQDGNNERFDNKSRPQVQRFYGNKEDNRYNNRSEYNTQTKKSYQTKTEDNQVEKITNGLGKVSLNSEFASRSLRQHLNLGATVRKEETVAATDTSIIWNKGDNCMAKYWEDGKFYNAVVTDVTDKTCVVRFRDYGNMEEVLKSDCRVVGKQDFRNTQYKPRRQYT